nr:MAG TPA: hypothetical protein [Caudoviricetes sp.]
MRYPSTKNLAGYYQTRAGAVVKAEKHNGMWTVHIGLPINQEPRRVLPDSSGGGRESREAQRHVDRAHRIS